MVTKLHHSSIIYIGTNDSPCKTDYFICKELMNVKETINKFHPNYKSIVVISSPIGLTDKKELNNMLKKYSSILKWRKMYVIFLNNISASHLHRDDLHLNLNGTIPNFRVSMAVLNTIDISHRRCKLNFGSLRG